MSETMKSLLRKVCAGHALGRDEAEQAFDLIMSGQLTNAQIAGFLVALKVRGETIDELVGAVSVMRAKMTPVELDPAIAGQAIDIVGTGGDGKGSYNVSTATAFVVAACGIPVAKHGNRAVSSRSGSADVLEAVGVNLSLSPEQIARCVSEAGVGFMFAPMHHTAIKHVAQTRVELSQRTIFNLIGPLSNPAKVRRQLIGVYDARWLVPMAETLNALGCDRAWLVYGSNGMDEMTTTGETQVAKLENGAVTSMRVDPTALGMELVDESAFVGGDAAHNAKALRAVLAGEPGPYSDIVALNVAGSLCVADAASSLDDGLAKARATMASGKALETLERLVSVSNAGS